MPVKLSKGEKNKKMHETLQCRISNKISQWLKIEWNISATNYLFKGINDSFDKMKSQRTEKAHLSDVEDFEILTTARYCQNTTEW